LYIQFKCKSHYKLYKKYVNDGKTKQKNIVGTEIFSNLINVIFMLILKKKKSSICFSFFFLPTKKKTITFLRAPYKNKLAQLSILRLEYTFIMVFNSKYTNTWDKNQNIINFNKISKLNRYFCSLNVSGTKFKHTSTKTKLNSSAVNNFFLKNFI